jgi:hypothetical protein
MWLFHFCPPLEGWIFKAWNNAELACYSHWAAMQKHAGGKCGANPENPPKVAWENIPSNLASHEKPPNTIAGAIP